MLGSLKDMLEKNDNLGFLQKEVKTGTMDRQVQLREHCTVNLLFDLFGLVCLANKNKNCQLSYT